MATFRFLHCADIHLDSPLRGLEADPDAPAIRIRNATRDAFAALVDYAIEHKVDFVLAAGDLYDGNWKDWRTGQFLIKEVARLSRANIPFIAISGNHDAESIITRQLTLQPPAYKMSAAKPEIRALPHLDVLIHGQSFPAKVVNDDLSKNYPAREEGKFNIGLLHTNVSGIPNEHENYAPSNLADLRGHGYDYWALGHVHTRNILSEDPWIIYPGNLQGRHVRETGPKGAMLVTVHDRKIAQPPQFIAFDTVRWDRIHIDLRDAENEDAALALIRRRLTDSLSKADGRLLAARVVLTGATKAYAAFSRDPETTREKVRTEAIALGGSEIWIESVAVDIAPPRSRTETPSLLAAEIARLTPAEFYQSASVYLKDMLGRGGQLRENLVGAEAKPRNKQIEAEEQTSTASVITALAQGELPASLFERARNLLLARLAED